MQLRVSTLQSRWGPHQQHAAKKSKCHIFTLRAQSRRHSGSLAGGLPPWSQPAALVGFLEAASGCTAGCLGHRAPPEAVCAAAAWGSAGSAGAGRRPAGMGSRSTGRRAPAVPALGSHSAASMSHSPELPMPHARVPPAVVHPLRQRWHFRAQFTCSPPSYSKQPSLRQAA